MLIKLKNILMLMELKKHFSQMGQFKKLIIIKLKVYHFRMVKKIIFILMEQKLESIQMVIIYIIKIIKNKKLKLIGRIRK